MVEVNDHDNRFLVDLSARHYALSCEKTQDRSTVATGARPSQKGKDKNRQALKSDEQAEMHYRTGTRE